MLSNDVSPRAIKSFGEVITGKTPSTAVSEYYGYDVPFIKTPDMHGSVFITESECYLSEAGANSQKSKYIPANSVVVACIGANAGEVSLTSYKAQTNQQINSIITEYPCFLYFAIKGSHEKLRTLGDGSSTMLNINKTSFETFQIDCVNINILNELEKKLSVIFKEILSNSLEINALKRLNSLTIAKLSR